MKQESLLPGTDAIRKETLEWNGYRGKQLVRYKDADGNAFHCHTADYGEAEAKFYAWLEDMRTRAKRRAP